MKLYRGFSWELVQTHLIFPDGHMQELWRPTENGGDVDPENLKKVLKQTIQDLNLQPKQYEETPGLQNRSFEFDSGYHILTVVRVPYQENYPTISTYGIDWIHLDEVQFSELLPPEGSVEPHRIEEKLAKDILIQFRAPLETDTDRDEDAIRHIQNVSLYTQRVNDNKGKELISIKGNVLMQDPRELFDVEYNTEKWIKREKEEIHISGYIELNAEGQAKKFQVAIDSAYLIPPNKKKIAYTGAGYLVSSQEDL